MSNFFNAPNITAAAVTVGAISAYYAYKKYNENQIKLPVNWHHVGTLSDLYVYPIKSCGPVLQKEAECTTLGLREGWLRDRVLLVMDVKNNFITARAYPELLLVQPSVKGSVLTLKHVEMEDLYVNLAEVGSTESKIQATVWGCPVPVYDCGDVASEWFSRLLAKSPGSFRLAYYASQDCRPFRDGFKENNLYKRWLKSDTGAFPDEVPYNIINQASVDELNTRLDISVTPRNFRPNFVVQGAVAYEEDQWRFVKIGDNVFEVIKPCTRCVMTTIDPETGVRNINSEPLKTLKTYRQIEDATERRAAGESPRMGVQMALRSSGGLVRLNDNVYVA